MSDFSPVDQDARQRAADGPGVQYGAHDQKHTLNPAGTAHARALARRGVVAQPEPSAVEARLARVEATVAALGGRSVVRHGDMLTVREPHKPTEININIIWNGQPSVIAVRARVVS